MKYFKIFGIALLTLLILLVLTFIFLPKKVYLDWAIKSLESQYPIELGFKDGSMAFLPVPSIALQDVTITLKGDVSSGTKLLEARSLDLSTRWVDIRKRRLPLIIHLSDAKIHLNKNLLDHSYKPPTGPISLKRFDTTNTTVYYQNEDKEISRHRFDNLRIKHIESQDNNHKFDINIKGRLAGVHLKGNLATSFKLMKAEKGHHGTMDIQSDALDLLILDEITLKQQAISAQLAFHHSNGTTKISKGHLDVLSQKFSFSATHQDSGALEITLECQSLDLSSLKAIFPKLKSLPAITQAGIEVHYAKPATKNIAASISGSLTAPEIKFPHYSLQDASLAFIYHDPLLQIRNFKGKMMEGTLAGDAEMDLTPKISLYKFELNLKDIAAEKVRTIKPLLSGRGNLTLKATGKAFEKDWTDTLNGQGLLSIKDTQLPTLKLLSPLFNSPEWEEVKRIPEALNQKALKEIERIETQVSDGTINFEIMDGIVQVPQVVFKFPQAEAQLSGFVNLDQSLAFEGFVKWDKTFIDALIQDHVLKKALIKDQKDLQSPIRVVGSLETPVVVEDNEFFKERLQTFLKERAVEMTRETIKESLQERQMEIDF